GASLGAGRAPDHRVAVPKNSHAPSPSPPAATRRSAAADYGFRCSRGPPALTILRADVSAVKQSGDCKTAVITRRAPRLSENPVAIYYRPCCPIVTCRLIVRNMIYQGRRR